jgi:hypothetical protein
MRKLILLAVLALMFAGIAGAVDLDRHATISDPKTPNAPTQCKGFYGTDDNRTACNDFCSQYRTQNQGADCRCDEGKCSADDHP